MFRQLTSEFASDILLLYKSEQLVEGIVMDELDIQILLSLAETGSLTKTAASLFLAQPTLTKRLQNLEQELGTNLFLRSKNGISVTPMGEKTIETMRSVSDQLSGLRAFIQQNQDYVGGSLTVASSLDYSRYCLPSVLERYAHEFPKVNLKITTAHSSTNHQRLVEGHCHAAIVRGEYNWDGERIKLSTEPICLIRSRDNADKPLESLRYISRYTDNNHMTLQTRWLIEHNLNPESTLNVDTLSTVVKLTQNGIGWSIVPGICLDTFIGVREPLFFEDGTPLLRNTYLLYRKRDYALPQLREFVRIAVACSKK